MIEETTERVETRALLMQEARKSAVGRLAAGIAHELNNPLATLVAHVELAVNYLKSLEASTADKALLDELRDYLSVIETQAFRCKDVTGSILSLPWKEGLEITEIDINGLLDSIVDSADTGKSEARIVREFSPLPNVRGNVDSLRQVFLNLISNACDAVEGRMGATVRVTTSAPAGEVVVRVRDNGNGVPAAMLNKIFEPFFTTKESKQGVGLGLALCREFLTHAGGSVRAESSPGRGSTFIVTLPAKGARKR